MIQAHTPACLVPAQARFGMRDERAAKTRRGHVQFYLSSRGEINFAHNNSECVRPNFLLPTGFSSILF